MKDTEALRTLRDRIILAGIAEISRNGITGFSMRRVAASCNISCATPYRYFENKNTFILEMLRYIRSQWELMERSVCAAYDDELEKITEVCLTFILFLNANPQFLAVIMLGDRDATSEQTEEKRLMTEGIENRIITYSLCKGESTESAAQTAMLIKARLYGTTFLMHDAEKENDVSVYERVRSILRRELES